MLGFLFIIAIVASMAGAGGSHQAPVMIEAAPGVSVALHRWIEKPTEYSPDDIDVRMKENSRVATETCGMDAVQSVSVDGFNCK
uniref:Uncharacterized protein n=1 Tax=viral metagenome TaxID=1070528 RepID=A0A6M3LP19_9ZZZZ